MPLNIDGAGRSRSLACLPTARGTVAPTRGQVPGGVLLGTSTGPSLKSMTFSGFLPVDSGGVWGQGPLPGGASRTLRAPSPPGPGAFKGPPGLQASSSGASKVFQASFENLQGPQAGLQPYNNCKPLTQQQPEGC